MTTAKDDLVRRFQRRFSFENFFTGRIYPLIVIALVLVGYFTKLEIYTNAALAVLTFVALMCSKTIRPLLPYLFTVLYQIPAEHQLKDPTLESEHLFSGWHAYVVLASLALVIVGAFIFLMRQGLRHRRERLEGLHRWKPLPLFVPTLIFSVAMLLAGYGVVSEYATQSTIFAVGQVVVYLVLFAMLYRGLEDENTQDFLAYFAYVTLLAAVVLNTEVIVYQYDKYQELGFFEFVRDEGLFAQTEDIPEIALGFGDANLVAYNIGALIPMQLYGFAKCKGRLIYLLSALATYVCAVSCVSRTTTIAATLIFALGIVFAFFAGGIRKRRRVSNRIILAALIGCVIALVVIFPSQTRLLFQDLERTIPTQTEQASAAETVELLAAHSEQLQSAQQSNSDAKSQIGKLLDKLLGDINLSGRVKIWDSCGVAFEENPIFGGGFYFLEIPGSFYIEYMPWMAHNTLMYLLGAGGLVALIGYLIYRLATAIVFFKRPTTDKWFLFLVCLFLVVTGITDNYVFYFYTTFHYLVALAVACKINRELKAERRARKERVAQKLLEGGEQ